VGSMNRLAWLLVASLSSAGALGGQQSPAPAKPKVDFKKLKFMAGCWRGPIDKDSEVEEIWTDPAENLLVATTRYLTKGRATSFEFSKIQATDTAVVFSASTEGRPFDTYTLKTLVDEYVVFENLAKKFPQRIIYRLASDGVLIPRNEGDGQPSIEVRLEKVKCPGA
jgi:hypothetical protein